MSHDMGAPGPPKKSKVPLILGILGGGFLLCVACCGGCAYFGYSMGTEPMKAATEAMNANAAMTDKLGSPIEFELNNMQLRNLQNNNGNGGADVSFDTKGPKGTARVDAKLDLKDGEWSVIELTAKCSDGTELTMP